MSKEKIESIINILKTLKVIITDQEEYFNSKLSIVAKLITVLNQYSITMVDYFKNDQKRFVIKAVDPDKKDEFNKVLDEIEAKWKKIEKEIPREINRLTSEIKLNKEKISEKLSDIDYILEEINGKDKN